MPENTNTTNTNTKHEPNGSFDGAHEGCEELATEEQNDLLRSLFCH